MRALVLENGDILVLAQTVTDPPDTLPAHHPARVTYEELLKGLTHYGMFMHVGEKHADSPGARHMNVEDRAKLSEIRGRFDKAVSMGVYRRQPGSVLEEIELSRSRDGRKHFNPDEREKLKQWRSDQISQEMSDAVTAAQSQAG